MIQREMFKVDGMSCAACSARIEKSLSKTEGVVSAAANFSSGKVSVEYDPSITDIEKVYAAVESAGYTVIRKGVQVQDKSRSVLISLIVSLVFAIPVVIISMGPMFGFTVIDDMKVSAAVQFALSIPVIIAGRRFFTRGIPAFFARSSTMDTLVALGSGTAFVYSTVMMILMYTGDAGDTHLYFESAVMILTLISVGKYLESRSREKTNEAVSKLKHLVPDTANVIVGTEEISKPVSELEIGDVLVIRPGERVPADCQITSGTAAVDESMLTGESVPVEKWAGDKIYGGTICSNGSLIAEVIVTGEDSALSHIINMVEDAQSTKAPIARTADKVAVVFVPCIIVIALVAFFIWLRSGADINVALTVLISVLVISCPCAMGLATPLAITVGTGRAANFGILFRNAESLERSGTVDYILLDKTGTITEGRPSVTTIYPEERAEEILHYTSAPELHSEHPFSKAIVKRATELNIEIPKCTDFEYVVGAGIKCTVDGKQVAVGNLSLMYSVGAKFADFLKEAKAISAAGSSVIYVAIDGVSAGLIGVSDTVREDAKSSVSVLNEMGVSVKMITGDGEIAARSVARTVGIKNILYGAKPEDKVSAIKKLQARERDVAMVGDGINDAPALSQADLGIAIGSGTDIAMDSADIIIMNDNVLCVPATLEIGRATLKNIKQNLFFAFCYNLVCIPLAIIMPYLSGGVIIEMMPMISAACMSLSSISVVSNALRLRGFKPKSLN